MSTSDPVMCSYKVVEARLDVWGIQGKVEEFLHRQIREILLLGHRQAVAWMDDWHGMTIEDVREYEERMQRETNERLRSEQKGEATAEAEGGEGGQSSSTAAAAAFARSASVVDQRWDTDNEKAADALDGAASTPAPESASKKGGGWFSWSW